MKNTKNSTCNYQECGFNYTLALISGKYKMSVLYCLYKDEIVRYNELNRILSPISFKTLTNVLRELESDGLITRKEYPQIPPKVEYSLSQKGQSFIPILQAMCDWGEKNKRRMP
ncbi:TPA: winged helix-turn-helix transcriptional regulator [Campylobacter jejuni]